MKNWNDGLWFNRDGTEYTGTKTDGWEKSEKEHTVKQTDRFCLCSWLLYACKKAAVDSLT